MSNEENAFFSISNQRKPTLKEEQILGVWFSHYESNVVEVQ